MVGAVGAIITVFLILAWLVLFGPATVGEQAIVKAVELGAQYDLTVTIYRTKKGYCAYYADMDNYVVIAANGQETADNALKLIMVDLQRQVKYARRTR